MVVAMQNLADGGLPPSLMPKWRQDAACRGPHQAIFFPPSVLEKRIDKRNRELRAKEICESCPVLHACRAHAINIREQHGIWGGLTENERRDMADSN